MAAIIGLAGNHYLHVLMHIAMSMQGGAKVQEAFFIFQELGDRYNWTVR